MPNWCMNILQINHDDKNVIDDLEKDLTDMEEFSLLRTLDESYDLREAHEVDWSRVDDNSIVINFDTAWSPPISVYESLENRGFEVYATFYEPGMDFAGFYEEGDERSYTLSEYEDEWFEENPDGIVLNENWNILDDRESTIDWEEIDIDES